ncbi:MAG: hypothetical protein MJY57_02220 [Bacteroidales bacterium]|nr:hypothetical protein [Bacteroidales bacterium]
MKRKIILYSGIVLSFLVLAYAFVPQVLSGKIVNQSDISGWQGMSREMMSWNAAHPSDQTAWTDSMFGGMPTTTIHASTRGDWTQPVYDFLLTGRRPATYFFISLLGAFLMLLAFGISPLLAAFGAVAVTFCSYNVQIVQVGHNTKMQALAFLPWVLAALVFTYRSSRKERGFLPLMLLGAAFFGLTLSFQVKANHPQITYYLAIMILLYAVVEFVYLIVSPERRKALGRFFAASALLLVLGIAGIGTNAIKLLPTWEYTPYSMRGGSTEGKDDGENAGAKGLKLDYATSWSYGWEELPNLLIPNYNGGSSTGAVNPKKSETYALLKKAGQPNLREVCKALPLYWGPQPFTAGPMYMGAITIFLFILGLMCFRGRWKWWIVAVSLIAVLLALGRNLRGFTRFFYNYAPMYNKFRTVSMSLVVLQFTLPLLGFLGVDALLKQDVAAREKKRKVLVAAAVGIGLCLFFAIIQAFAGSFTGDVDAGQPKALQDALAADRYGLLWADTWRSIIFIAGAAVLLVWAVSDTKGSRSTAAAVALGALVVIDLFTVGKRYLSADDFVTPRQFSGQFAKRPVDEMILSDTDPSYRVLDLTVNVFNDSHPSYWHKNIGGYSPAKLMRYQEFIDSHLVGEIRSVYGSLDSATTIAEAEEALPYCAGLAALNCRYIIVGAENPPLRYRYAKGPAWFEGTEGSVEMKSYAPNELRYSCSSEEGGTVVFSEVYYPEGWKLTMDGGEPLPIAPASELAPGCEGGSVLRAARVPAGSHELVMRFEPVSYARGEAVSRLCSIIILLLSLVSVGFALFYSNSTTTGKVSEG